MDVFLIVGTVEARMNDEGKYILFDMIYIFFLWNRTEMNDVLHNEIFFMAWIL